FATNFYVGNNVGPAGIAFPASGGVLVCDGWGYIYKFPNDSNGQNAGNVPRITNADNDLGMAVLNGHVYMVRKNTGTVVQLDDAGNQVQTIMTGINGPEGMVADLVPGPLYGHLLVATSNSPSVYDIDPVAKTKRAIIQLDQAADGLVLDHDSNVLY